jgi:hypothetical protein
VEFWMEYADVLGLRLAAARPALWTCRLRTPVMSFRRALCGAAQKTVMVTSWMELLWWS